MANIVKNYFLAPSWDYAPDAKPGVTIALWNLVTSPTEMVPPLLAAKAQPGQEDMLKSTKDGFEWTRGRESQRKFGVWAKFLQVVGLGLALGHRRTTSVHDLYTFASVETREAYPTRAYIENMVKDPSVVRYLKKTDFENPLYLVVGTKSVTGAAAQQVLKQGTSSDANLSVHGSPLSAPVCIGPEASVFSSNGDTLGFKASSEFVFAFRIRKIKVNPHLDVDDQGDEREGTFLGYDGEPVQAGFDVLGIEDNDRRIAELAADLDGRESVVEEHGEKVYVTVLGIGDDVAASERRQRWPASPSP